MARRPDVGDRAESARQAGQSVYQTIVDVLLTGIVVIVPLVVTLFVLSAAFSFIFDALRPFIQVLRWAGLIESVKNLGVVDFLITVGIYQNVTDFVTTIVAVLILLAIIVVTGLLARIRYGEQLIDYLDAVIGAIPGVGSVYRSFRRMGDTMLESSVENFREVVLVEFPHDDVYVLGFKTAETALPISAAAGESPMTTLFLPLAPNPVMGGFLAHVPDDRVRPVDMTVDDAVRIIITSGIATERPDDGTYRDLSADELAQLGDLARGQGETERTAADGDGQSSK
jgi:uncharacterized membrane protein